MTRIRKRLLTAAMAACAALTIATGARLDAQGFPRPGIPLMSIGDFVWYDTNNNGILDGSEQPVAGVDLALFRDNGDGVFNPATDTPVGGQVTSAAGRYLFSGLVPGGYFVQVPPTEFAVGQPLFGYQNSSGQTLGDINNADHGAPVPGLGVVSGLVTLIANGAPTNDGDTDPNTNLTIDFSFYRLSLGNLVFDDLDNSGTFNSGDVPRNGVQVDLLDSAGTTVLLSMATMSGGLYEFTGLPPGDYRVRITPPAGFTSSTGGGSEPGADPDNDVDNDDNGTNAGAFIVSAPITLTPGGEPSVNPVTGETVNNTLDFGLIRVPLSLGNLVWADANDNGVVDAGEAGIAGVTVRLIAANGTTVLATTTTNAAGQYLFTGLAAGTYSVEVDRTSAALAGHLSSTDTATSANPNNDVDNDDNGVLITATTVRSNPVMLTVGGEPVNDGDTDPNTNLTIDFGFVPPATLSLGNYVWRDVNNDGLVSAGEPGLNGVTVRLLNATGTSVLATQVTAGGGFYLFTGLAPGDYVVEVVTPAGHVSSSGGGTEPASDPDNDIDNDDNGTTAGAVVRSLPVTLTAGGEPVTDGDTDPNTNLTVDFGFVPSGTLSLGNFVWIDLNNNAQVDAGEPGAPGVTVRLIAANGATVLATTTTNAAGEYLFAGLAPGTYFVEVDRASAALTGYLSSTDIATSADPDNDINNDDNGVVVTATAVRSGAVTLTLFGEPVDDGDADPNSNLSVDFGFVRALSLGNLVWTDGNDNGVVDAGESGIAGVTVRLLAANGVTVLQTTTTDASGHYLFGGLPPGTYVVEVVPPPGSVSSTDVATSANPDNDVDNDDNGVTVTASGVRSGPVTLGLGSEPTDDGDGNPDSNLTVDFGFVPGGLLSLGNLVWLDLNNNGRAEAGEPGAPGVTVRLVAANGTTVLSSTTTSATGHYLFTSLPAGSYIVEVDRTSSAITGYLSSTDITTSANPDNDEDNDDNGVLITATTVRSNPVTLTLFGEPITDGDADPNSNLSVDFGFVRTVSLGNLVWVDDNNNALVDAGEAGRADVTVRLLGADCATVVASTTTNADGNYLFGGLLPGTYCVEVMQPLGLQSSSDIGTSANPDNDRDNDDNGVTIIGDVVRSGPVTLAFGLEPVDDGDTNPDSNLSVDFGFVPETGGGFLADICLGQTIPSAVVAGAPFTAIYTAVNRGPGVAQNVVIDGMLPAGLFVVATAPSAGGACTITATNVDCRWPGGTPAGIDRSVVVTFNTAPTVAPGSVIWLWFMTHSSNPDPNPACAVTDSYVFVTGASGPSADLVITASSASGMAGGVISGAVNRPVSARFTVANSGSVPARGRYAILLDEGAGIELTAASATQGWLGVSSGTAGTWETDPIAPGGTAVLSMTFVPRSGLSWRIQAIRTEGAPADPNAANDTAQFTIDGIGTGGGRFVAAGNIDGAPGHEMISGTGQGETPQVRVFTGTGGRLFEFFAFVPTFHGGVRVASCDVDGNGVDELIAAQGPGGGRVRVLSLAGGYVAEMVAFDPFEAGFAGGVNVACGDLDGDGRAEVVVGPEAGRAPDVKVFAVGPLSAVLTTQFQAYEPAFTGGVRVSATRFAGSGVVGAFNIATTPGPGRAVDVRMWLAGGGSAAQVFSAGLMASTTGARVVLGDVDGDSSLDLVVTSDSGTPWVLRAYALSTGALVLDATAGAGGYRSVTAAVGVFAGGPGRPELLAGSGPGETPTVATYIVGSGSVVGPRVRVAAAEVP